MKANELRIGNAVQDKSGREWVIHELLESYCRLGESIDGFDLSLGYSELQPITLTEEWLLKFGFVNTKSGYEFIIHSKRARLSVILRPDGIGMVGISGPWGLYDSIHYKHVHQLQNLYHALTGEELEIK